jgi:hypothetical protein
MSEPFASYTACPECGRPNPERKVACAVCDTKLVSDDLASHQWYLGHLHQERRKKLLAVIGYSFTSLACLGLLVTLTFKVRAAPGYAIIGCTALALIATYRSATKLGHLRRFFRSLAHEPKA